MSTAPEALARAMHNAWTAEIRSLGYRSGGNDGSGRTHSSLVVFDELDDEVRSSYLSLADQLLRIIDASRDSKEVLTGKLDAAARDTAGLLSVDDPSATHAIVLGFLHEYERSDTAHEPAEIIRISLQRSAELVMAMTHSSALHAQILQATHVVTSCVASGGKVLAIGNGGSMADAMHFTTELAGQFRKSRAGLSAISASDPTFLSCVANDHGYEHVFSRFVESVGTNGDALVAISTSGSSENVLNGASSAKTKGISIIAMTGAETSPLGELADVHVVTPGDGFAGSVQEQQKIILHTMCEVVESLLSLD
jgi:D-sedoheptulose 7-phosphate isomerase